MCAMQGECTEENKEHGKHSLSYVIGDGMQPLLMSGDASREEKKRVSYPAKTNL